ncbi:MAG TPA: hypothetical protein VI300_23040, partial [Solirubrobacter sp.]
MRFRRLLRRPRRGDDVCPRPRRGRVLSVVAVVAVAALVTLAGSEPAQAVGLGPIGDVLGAGLNAVSGGMGGIALEGFQSVLGALFAWPAQLVNRVFLAWLISVPDYAVAPDTLRGQATSSLSELADTTSAMAFAALAAAGTVGGLRYWAAGLTGSGSFDALEGFARMVGAALLIVLWPWIFRHAVDLANAAGTGLLGSPGVLDDTSQMMAAAFTAGVSPNFFSIVIACAAGLLFLALALCKLAVGASTALIYVAMPIALLLWVIPELGWVARTALRAFAVVLLIPIAWALSFATFAAVGVDALTGRGSGSLADGLIKPLVALALLWQCVALPRAMARMALLGAGGGTLARLGGYLVARRVDAAVTHAASAAGNRASQPQLGPAPPAASPAAAYASAPTPANGAAVFSTATAPAASAAPAAGGPNRPGRPPEDPTATAPSTATPDPNEAPRPDGWSAPPGGAAAAPQDGLPSPSWREIRDRVPLELDA